MEGAEVYIRKRMGFGTEERFVEGAFKEQTLIGKNSVLETLTTTVEEHMQDRLSQKHLQIEIPLKPSALATFAVDDFRNGNEFHNLQRDQKGSSTVEIKPATIFDLKVAELKDIVRMTYPLGLSGSASEEETKKGKELLHKTAEGFIASQLGSVDMEKLFSSAFDRVLEKRYEKEAQTPRQKIKEQ